MLHDDEDQLMAAAHYSVEEHFDETGFANRLKVEDLFGVDESWQVALWRWLLGRNLVGEVSCWRMDPGSVLAHAMEDPRLLVTTELADTTWLRIVFLTRWLKQSTVFGGYMETVSSYTLSVQTIKQMSP